MRFIKTASKSKKVWEASKKVYKTLSGASQAAADASGKALQSRHGKWILPASLLGVGTAHKTVPAAKRKVQEYLNKDDQGYYYY